MEKTISQKDYKPYVYIAAFLAAFGTLYALNFILPIQKVIFIDHHNDITGRATNWCYLLTCALATYYIVKIRKFTLLDLMVGIVLGFVGWRVGYNGYISAITVSTCYYSACQIFRKYSQENKYFNLDAKKFLKSLAFGVLLAIPFAVVNSVTMFFMNSGDFKGFSFSNVIPGVVHALPPGICEEIIFRFFLLAFVTQVFKGNMPKDKLTLFLVYALCIIPHNLIHFPMLFSNSIVMGIAISLYTALLFGIPMTWLMKNKNLQTASAFHWMIDFIRFIF